MAKASNVVTLPDPEGDSPYKRLGMAFDAAYHEWLEARTELEGLGIDKKHTDVDKEILKALDRIQAAETQLIGARPIRQHQVFQKLEVIEHAVLQTVLQGSPIDRRHIALVAAIKVDLLMFTLKPNEE
jgi:hypothetical protein